jgi:hypothetical protein
MKNVVTASTACLLFICMWQCPRKGLAQQSSESTPSNTQGTKQGTDKPPSNPTAGLPAGGPTCSLGNGGHRLKLENTTGLNIFSIYVSSVNSDSWAKDLLGSNTLRPGSTFTINGLKSGRYDFRFVDADGGACVVRDVLVYENRNLDLTPEALLQCESHSSQ